MCYKVLGRELFVWSDVTDLKFYMSVIPNIIREYEKVLVKYIEEKDNYDLKLKDFQQQSGLSSPRHKKSLCSQVEEDYDLNRRRL